MMVVISGHLEHNAVLQVDQEEKTVAITTIDGGLEVFPVHDRDGCWTVNPEARARFETEVMDLFKA